MKKNRLHKMRLIRQHNVRKIKQRIKFAQSNIVRRSVVVASD